MSDVTRTVYDKLRAIACGLGDDVDDVGAVKQYIRFSVGGRNFAEMKAQTDCVLVHIRPEGPGLAPGTGAELSGLRVERVSAASTWTLNTRFRVRSSTDLAGVATLLRQSYEAAKRRRRE